MQEGHYVSAAPRPIRIDDDAFLADAHIAGLLERLRREPALRAWVLTAPTGALATLGVVLDDKELVLLLERIEALDERALPVTARDVMSPDPVTLPPRHAVHEAAQALSEHRISGAPVISDDGSIAGIVSEYDLIARIGSTVGDVMTRAVVARARTRCRSTGCARCWSPSASNGCRWSTRRTSWSG